MRTVYSSYTALFLTLAVLLLPLFSRSEVTSPHPEKAFAMPAHASPLPPVPTHSIGHSCSAVRPHSSSGSVLPTTQFDVETESLEVTHVESEYKKALVRTTVTVSSAVAFGIGIWAWRGRKSAFEFFAGYLVEQSLSVDNLFVFIMLFDYFKVPLQYQARVLTWGIIGAVAMRGVMIGLGVAAVQRFRGIILAFAGILIASAVKLLKEDDSEEDLENNFVMKISRFCFRSTTEYDGENFFTRIKGIRYATPLLMCLVCIELSDFVFAVDSIPAVLGVSKDPFIVYTSNVFAIMGLRSLYTLVARAVTDLPFLRPAVALVLAFVGGKMILEYFHYEVGTGISLAVVASLLAGGVGLSVWKKRFIAAQKGFDVRGHAKHERQLV